MKGAYERFIDLYNENIKIISQHNVKQVKRSDYELVTRYEPMDRTINIIRLSSQQNYYLSKDIFNILYAECEKKDAYSRIYKFINTIISKYKSDHLLASELSDIIDTWNEIKGNYGQP